MKRTWTIAIALLLAGGFARAADPVGLLTSVTGNVQLLRAGERAPAAARTADVIRAGDHLIAAGGARADFIYCPALQAGGLAGPGDLEFGPAAIKAVKGAVAGQRAIPGCRLPPVALSAASRQSAGLTRLRGSNLMLRSPSRTNVATLRPTFVWNAVDNATAYDVKVMDRDERMVWQQTVKSTRADYPAGSKELAWGEKYLWRVTARGGDDLLAETGTWFQVLPEEQAQRFRREADELERMLKENPRDEGPRFLLAFLYDENGLLDEAVHAYAQLRSADWAQARVQQLLGKLGWEAP